MDVPALHKEEHKDNQAETPNSKGVSKSANVATSGDREAAERAKPVRRDPHAAQKLARKKRMKAAHRRRLKASHAKG